MTPDPEYHDDTNVIDPDYGNAEITPEMEDVCQAHATWGWFDS